MGIDYSLIASIVLYWVVVKTFIAGTMRVRSAALLVVIIPLLFSETLLYIMLHAYGASLLQLFAAGTLVKVVIQLIVAFGIFYKLREDDETYVTWLLWAIAGMIALYFVVPYVIRLILPI